MADLLRVVEFARGGRPFGVLDLEQADLPGGTVLKERDSFRVAPGQPKDATASSSRRWGGSRQVGQTHDNGGVTARWLVKGATEQAALDNFALFAEACARARPGRYIEWRPDGAPRSTYYELRGTAAWNPEYKWVDFAGTNALYVEATWPVAPLAEGDRMDVLDPFDLDSLADYTFDSGSASICTVAGGAVAPNGSLTTERRAIHTARGYVYLGGQGTVRFAPGATINGYKAAAELRRSGATTYLEVYVDDNGTNSRLRVDKVVAGARTNLQTTNLAARIADGVFGAARGRVEGNLVYAEYFTGEPTPMAAPTLAPAAYQLTAADQTDLPAGQAGWGWTPQHAGARLLSFEFLPYTWRAAALPAVLPVGAVPGDEGAPAAATVHVTHSGGAAAPAWALLGWWRKPGRFNYAWNGDFEVDAAGWTVAAVTGVTGAATSMARVTAAAKVKYGVGALEVVTPATANTGASFAIYGRFRRGVTYTAELWANSAAQTTLARLRLGMNGDIASETAAALSATMTRRTVTWTPTADRDQVFVAFEVTAATATTMAIDGVAVYEGAVAPTSASQVEGRGAVPPVGHIDAIGASLWTTFAGVADANYRGGFGLRATASGAGTASAEWLVDPSLLVADDFTQSELDVEVWARVELASTLVSPKLTLSTQPEAGASFGPQRWTSESGPTGRILVKPSSGTAFRLVRLGTLTFYINPGDPARWRLTLGASWTGGSSGSFGLDQLLVVPLARRAASGPTGRALDSQYPKFAQSTAETTRVLRSDGSGMTVKPPGAPHPDVGMGRPLELDAGEAEALLALSSLAPDDPTSNATSEQEDHSATVHFEVVPRFLLARGA